jgi:enoyl-CoA hydratase/carnithine racemase
MNALSRQVVQEIAEVAEEAETNPEVKAVVVWGGPKIFAAGADIGEFTAPTSGGGSFDSGKSITEAFISLAEIPKVTIAAINGYALGGGCELAMTCDFRYAADDARLGQPEILLGIIPGAGGTQRLPRLVGVAKAKDIVFTGRRVDAEEALRIGLVDRIYPASDVFDKAVEEAARFAKGPLVALKAAKRAIDKGVDTDLRSGLAIEQEAFIELFATEDARIGVQSFFEKGPGKAEFVGR